MGLRTHINLERKQETAPLQASFRGYVALGYDFGKKINHVLDKYFYIRFCVLRIIIIENTALNQGVFLLVSV